MLKSIVLITIYALNFVRSDNVTDCMVKVNQTFADIKEFGTQVTNSYGHIETKINESANAIDCRNISEIRKTFKPHKNTIDSLKNDSCANQSVVISLERPYHVYMYKANFLDFLCTLSMTEIKGNYLDILTVFTHYLIKTQEYSLLCSNL